jgi:ABC-type transporter Mla subunit MlaD
MVDPTTAARLRILINESGVALSGQGSNFNALLSALPGSLQQLGTMISGFAQDNQNLTTLITQGDQVISSADSRRVDLQRLITNADQTLSVVASRRAQLAATVGSATPGLQQLNATLVRLQSVAADLQPTAVDISQTAPYLANTLAQLPSFAAAANPALREAKASAPYIDRLSTQATPTVRSLTPTLSNLKSFATLLQPTMTTLADQGAFQSLLRFANNWATLTDLSDGLGHVFRVHLTIDPQTLGFPGTTLGSTQSKRPRSAGQRPPAGCTSCATTPAAPRASGSPGSQPRGAGPAKPAPAPTTAAPQPGSNPQPSEPGASGNPVTNIAGLLQYLFGP